MTLRRFDRTGFAYRHSFQQNHSFKSGSISATCRRTAPDEIQGALRNQSTICRFRSSRFAGRECPRTARWRRRRSTGSCSGTARARAPQRRIRLQGSRHDQWLHRVCGEDVWESHPDIIVTDLSLLGGDGWQLIQDLKREARTRDIPVVLLTGHEATLVTRPRRA